MSMYDLIIVGAGPAGMTAGVYAARKKLKTLIITKDIGGQAAWSHDIENYPGFAMIAGSDLAEKFEHHLEGFKDSVELKLSAKGVSKIEKADKHFSIDLADGSSYSSKTVIIAGGKVPRPLNVSGEKDFLNRGVTYCSWCDGPLFRGKEVAIIGGGNSALDAALNVQKFVKQIYIVNLTPQLTADKVMVDKVKAALHMRILNNT